MIKNSKSLLQKLSISPTDDNIFKVVDHFKNNYVSVDEISHLAQVIAESGEKIALATNKITADVASTGGPTSLSTLLCPLYLALFGAYVPKLGVPGRPAGGIDCLAQVPGYKTILSGNTVISILKKSRYAHFLASGTTAPLDGRMFKIRQKVKAQNIPSLVISSLLGKKLAVGVENAGVDIRVFPGGNFGINWKEAKENAKLLIRVAKHLGVKAVAFLSEGRFPYQPYIGRAESLIALEEVFSGLAKDDLASHSDMCKSMAIATLGGTSISNAIVDGASLRGAFYEHLIAQGADPSDYETIVSKKINAHKFELEAETDGFFCVSLTDVRSLMVDAQESNRQKSETFPDPIGIKLIRRPGDWVKKGEIVATVRVSSKNWEKYNSKLLSIIGKPSKLPFGKNYKAVTNE